MISAWVVFQWSNLIQKCLFLLKISWTTKTSLYIFLGNIYIMSTKIKRFSPYWFKQHIFPREWWCLAFVIQWNLSLWFFFFFLSVKCRNAVQNINNCMIQERIAGDTANRHYEWQWWKKVTTGRKYFGTGPSLKSWLPFTAVRHGESYLTSLSLNLSTYKLRVVPTLYGVAVKIQ